MKKETVHALQRCNRFLSSVLTNYVCVHVSVQVLVEAHAVEQE